MYFYFIIIYYFLNCLFSSIQESGDKIDLLKALEMKVAKVQRKGTKSKSVLTVIEVCHCL